MKWVDDFLVIWLPGQTWTEEDFTSLTENIGVPWSHAKTRPFALVQQYIGFDWNLAGAWEKPLSQHPKQCHYMEN